MKLTQSLLHEIEERFLSEFKRIAAASRDRTLERLRSSVDELQAGNAPLDVAALKQVRSDIELEMKGYANICAKPRCLFVNLTADGISESPSGTTQSIAPEICKSFPQRIRFLSCKTTHLSGRLHIVS